MRARGSRQRERLGVRRSPSPPVFDRHWFVRDGGMGRRDFMRFVRAGDDDQQPNCSGEGAHDSRGAKRQGFRLNVFADMGSAWSHVIQMTDQYVEHFGYRNTDEDKNKILGLNAAKLYRIDPTAARCHADQTTFAALKRQLDNEVRPNRWALKHPLGPRTRREFFGMAKRARARGVPG